MKKAALVLMFLGCSLFMLAQDSGDLENKFYFRFGYSQPTKTYLGVDNDVFWDYYSRGGGVFELGQIFILNRIPLPDGLRIGINADYAEFTYNQLTNIEEDLVLGIFKISSKVGPSLSYNPVNDLVLDIFIKAKIPWSGAIASVSNDFDDVYLGIFGFGFSTGFNIRYKFIMAGFEFNKDQMKFENVDNPGEYFGNLTWEVDDSDKTSMPGFSFTFGFCF